MEDIVDNIGQLSLSEKTREISNNIAGYVAKKIQKWCEGCCDERLMDENSDGGPYLKILSRGGLKVGSPALNNYVAMGFAILDASESIIRKSDVPERKAGEHVLHRFLSQDEYGGFTCPKRQSTMCTKANK